MWTFVCQLSVASSVGFVEAHPDIVPVVFMARPHHRSSHLHSEPVSHALKKGQVLPMSIRTAPIETPLTPAQSLLVDRIGNEVYSSHYAERKAYRFIIACGTVVLLGSLGMNLLVGASPDCQPLHSYRRDGPRPGNPIQRSQLQPPRRRSPHVSDRLGQLPLHRHRDIIAKKYPLNYYFLSQALASRLMTDDNQNHLVSQVTAGQIESSDVAGPERNHHVHVRGNAAGHSHRPWNGPDDRGPVLLRAEFTRAPHRALDAQYYLLLESQTGQRPIPDLSAIRVHQSAGIDHHRVPREPHSPSILSSQM